jgi:hypothetical protein
LNEHKIVGALDVKVLAVIDEIAWLELVDGGEGVVLRDVEGFAQRSLSGLWAAAVAGLGVTVRTTLGLPSPLTVLGKSSGLPKLPQIALSLYTAQPEPPQAVARLREILIEELPLRG